MCTEKTCYIIPPYILEGLAKQGSVSCKKALNDTRRFQRKRSRLLNNLLVSEDQTGKGDRLVYDSKNEFKQKVELVRKEGMSKSSDEVVNSAYDTSGFVRDYFKETFGLNSMNDLGMDIVSNVHYGFDYNNAFWDGDEMTYGDGDGKEFKNFASAIDVVAHELMHGVTQFLANLEYRSQSGALNEHFSDAFGTIIKQKFLKQSIEEANWLIGDTVVTEIFPGEAIRSMKAPGTANDFDSQPDHMDNYYSGRADNEGVHINSGIPNKAFYLSCLEIGIDDCALIWFETLKELWRTADFNDMLEVILKISAMLESDKKVCDNASAAIERSFKAVGLISEVIA